ncbi:MAG: peptidoglycan-binding protein [Bifidobacteriaceae bacterium]|jgi:peptidoglycan hydrolase-like protein with peptidoglycan-binding domain|nr:peptidoglycan-binding protein [Bifidobacteriaceae bacterium]
MARVKKLSTMFISIMVLSAIILAAGALSPDATPARAAQSSASCTTSKARYDRVGTHKIYVPMTSASSRNCLLGQGNQSTAVAMLQLALNGPTSGGCYGRSIAPDGVFGPLTKGALKWVQEHKLNMTGRAVDGVYGVNTHNAMKFSDDPFGAHCYLDGLI